MKPNDQNHKTFETKITSYRYSKLRLIKMKSPAPSSNLNLRKTIYLFPKNQLPFFIPNYLNFRILK